MTASQPAAEHPGGPLDAVRRIVPLVIERADQAERDIRVDDEVMNRLVAAGTMTLMAPREYGGAEAEPSVLIDVIQELSRADGSTGWAVMACMSGTGTMLTLLPEGGARAIAESPDPTCAGQAPPTGTARRVPGGFEVRGLFSFASGSTHAGWFLGGYRILDESGEPVLNATGRPSTAIGVVPRGGVELLGGWDVMGLVATGSYDYEVKPQFVEEKFLRVDGMDALRGGPLHTMGLKSLPGVGHAAFALGVAQRALEEFAALAAQKKRPPSGVLNRNVAVQRDVAQWTARYKAARAFAHDAFTRLYRATRDGGRRTPEMQADCRVAATHAVYMAAEVTRDVYLASGSEGLRNGHIIQRCFRDAHAASQHLFTAEHTYVDAGRIYLGTPGLTPLHSEVMTYTFAPPLMD
ncbi:acyl-CoA dehydrogenase family protein [Streptosporangium sp. CA-115845]|uniref:acyl-CoA dehydrogenase family protein n=1 Tax=Streptosporangium sp. CA-115845 TaxID=3240071 RepID=UPI003D8BF386